MQRYEFSGPAGRCRVEIDHPAPAAAVTVPGGWFAVRVVCDRTFSLAEESAVVRGVADRLAAVPGRPFTVTNHNPCSPATGWGYLPWNVVAVYVQDGYLPWAAGSPAGLAPVRWADRKREQRPVPVYAGLAAHERAASGLELAVLRAVHELAHCYLGHLGLPGDGHTADPGDVMFGGGVRVGAVLRPATLAALAAVTP